MLRPLLVALVACVLLAAGASAQTEAPQVSSDTHTQTTAAAVTPSREQHGSDMQVIRAEEERAICRTW